ncbi:pogo transposable element with KRAB [Trichonephila clavipes]|nr:pogo transposable element with KRAB [Trichonephila clavipes]
MSRRKVFHSEEALEYMFSKEIESDIIALPPDVDELTDEEYFDDDEMTTSSVKDLSGNVEICVPMEEIEVVEKAEKDGNREEGRYFEVDEKAVRNWSKQKDVLKSMGRKRSNRHGKVKWPGLEENLLRWVLNQRNAGRSISTVKIHL